MLAADKNDISESTFLQLLQKKTGLAPQEAKAIGLKNSVIDKAVTEIIRQLKATYQIGLLTNAVGDMLERIFGEHDDLEGFFDELVISSHVGIVKPDPAIYELALEKLGVKPSEALFIDDSPRNVAAAQALGMEGLLFVRAEQLRQDLMDQGLLQT